MIIDGTVAILILLELTLQFKGPFKRGGSQRSRNPYFIGINSAMIRKQIIKDLNKCRNPYFIGINSAMGRPIHNINGVVKSQSLFYWN